MKTKNPMHPKFYIDIIKKNKDYVLVSYLSNKFNDDGDRVLQKEEVSNDLLQSDNIIEEMNKLELVALNKYLAIQRKVLEHHKKKKNFDSIKVVKDSIEVMEDFRRFY